MTFGMGSGIKFRIQRNRGFCPACRNFCFDAAYGKYKERT
jgi:hypothetical protein